MTRARHDAPPPRPLQTSDPKGFEALEVAVVRQDGVDAVLPAKGRDLGIEHQVAAGIRPLCRFGEKTKELRSGPDDAAHRGSDDRFDEADALQCLGNATIPRGLLIDDVLGPDARREAADAGTLRSSG